MAGWRGQEPPGEEYVLAATDVDVAYFGPLWSWSYKQLMLM